jgi:hypothetical protein
MWGRQNFRAIGWSIEWSDGLFQGVMGQMASGMSLAPFLVGSESTNCSEIGVNKIQLFEG